MPFPPLSSSPQSPNQNLVELLTNDHGQEGTCCFENRKIGLVFQIAHSREEPQGLRNFINNQGCYFSRICIVHENDKKYPTVFLILYSSQLNRNIVKSFWVVRQEDGTYVRANQDTAFQIMERKTPATVKKEMRKRLFGLLGTVKSEVKEPDYKEENDEDGNTFYPHSVTKKLLAIE